VVETRVRRSWTVKPDGWYHALREGAAGRDRGREAKAALPRVFTRSERLRKAVDRAYVAKFRTPWAAKLARASRPRAPATTTELQPL
jgi:hypothetical protein